MSREIELTLDELLLDEDNPRLGSVNSQSEAIEEIVHKNVDYFRNLMLSIKDVGLDPGDRFYVIKSDESNDYIVLEGNRRLAALLVLDNAYVLDGTDIPDGTKKSLARASKGFDLSSIEPFGCVLFDERSQANEWISRRHTGIQDGEGRIQWGPLEIQRFQGDRSVIDILDFVGRNADHSDDDWDSTRATIVNRKSSTFTRLLESKKGRQHLDVRIKQVADERVPVLGSDPKWALSVLRRMINDVRDGVVDSRNLNTTKDIDEYFKKLPRTLQPKQVKPQSPKPFRDINLRSGSTQKSKTRRAKKTTTPRQRKFLAPRQHPFQIPHSTKGENLLREAEGLNADKFPISAAFVLRGLVELVVNDYIEGNNLESQVKRKDGRTFDLTAKADYVAKHIVSSNKMTNSDVRAFKKKLVHKTSGISIQSLNDFVHNKFHTPTGESTRAGWDSCDPIFIATYGKAK